MGLVYGHRDSIYGFQRTEIGRSPRQVNPALAERTNPPGFDNGVVPYTTLPAAGLEEASGSGEGERQEAGDLSTGWQASISLEPPPWPRLN